MEHGTNPNHDHEMDRVLDHPVFRSAQEAALILDSKYFAAPHDDTTVREVYRRQAAELNEKAAVDGLIGSYMRVHSNGLRTPRVTQSSDIDDSLTIGWKIRQHTHADTVLGLPPSVTGNFIGFHHAYTEDKHQLVACVEPTEIHNSHYGSVTPYAWCPVQGAIFDVDPDGHELLVESALRVITDKTKDLPELRSAIIDMDDTAIKHKIGSTALNADTLHAVGAHGDALAANQTVRDTPGLAEAALDLLSARMNLPRTISIVADDHRQLLPLSVNYINVHRRTTFSNGELRLAFSDHGELARLCFAAISRSESSTGSPVVHIPFRDVVRVIRPR